MKAAVYSEDRRLVVEDVPDPVPDSHEVVIRVTYSAICGSDLHRYAHGKMPAGTILGHEFSGVVVAVGKHASTWKLGDRVTRCGGKPAPGRDVPNYPPRYSATERERLPRKPGAYAEYFATPEDKLMAIPEQVSDLDASLLEPLTVALHAVRLSKLRLGDTAVILGAGPIGLFTQQCAALAGAGDVYVSEINRARLGAAEMLGAHGVFNPSEMNLVDEVVSRTGIGADVAFECAGARSTLQTAMELVRMGGQVMLLSLSWEPVDLLPLDWVGREVELKSCYAYLNSEWPLAMALLRERKVRTEPMISKVIGLDTIDAAFQELLDRENRSIQVVVKCS